MDFLRVHKHLSRFPILDTRVLSMGRLNSPIQGSFRISSKARLEMFRNLQLCKILTNMGPKEWGQLLRAHSRLPDLIWELKCLPHNPTIQAGLIHHKIIRSCQASISHKEWAPAFHPHLQ